jgi:nucleotide-binding universal stress UspA family protein
MIAAEPTLAAPAEENSTCRALFEERLAARGLVARGDGVQGACFGWLDGETVTGRTFLGAYGRVFDVTVVGRPAATSDSLRMSTLEVALFESGRPVLIAPPAATASLGENVLIAWNGTPEVARSVAFATPLLRRARHIDIVTLDGGQDPQPSSELLGRHLRMNGISCEVHHAKDDAESRGAVFLAEAARLGSDLMIKGAYTQSRLRQMIFGGATRHIVTRATLPVFMAH